MEHCKELEDVMRKTSKEIEERRAIEDTPEVIELRRLRDEAQSKVENYQMQIDEKIKSLHGTPDIVGKFIKTTQDDRDHYGLVCKVDRLFYGIKINFSKAFDYYCTRRGAELLTMASSDMCYSIDINWKDLNIIEVITEDEYNRKLKNIIDSFDNSEKIG